MKKINGRLFIGYSVKPAFAELLGENCGGVLWSKSSYFKGPFPSLKSAVVMGKSNDVYKTFLDKNSRILSYVHISDKELSDIRKKEMMSV